MSVRVAKDHPRIRGEHGTGAPRCVRPRGIIPAYAGSTSAISEWEASEVDHPRIRGEHVAVDGGAGCRPGSSPHTRGARLHEGLGLRAEGIIPAYAGSTDDGALHGSADGDHPRIRGEHATSVGLVDRCAGSSPHTRGARHRQAGCRRAPWIIPAYAGSTQRCQHRLQSP